MGLFDAIKRVLGGDDAAPQDRRSEATRGKRWPRVRPVHAPSRHNPVRQPDAGKQMDRPYAFARHSPLEGLYLDRRVGGKAERIWKYGLPEFNSPQDLADWFKLPLKTLAWMADYHGSNAGERIPKKQHYHYRWHKKHRGRGWRLIEAPKPLLKLVQRRILHEILNKVPAHPAAHGFVKGRSILTNAAPHVGKYVVVRCDLADFYPSIKFRRVRSVFFGLGYNSEISWWLARLCTNRVPLPMDGPDGIPAWRALGGDLGRHLPQGAPTSPALANLSAWALDVRLSGLARKFGVEYTRYADDLTFSGDEKCLRGLTMAYLLSYIRGIVRNERFAFHPSKRKLTRRGGRQVVAGITVNEKPNVPRPYFDRLKATLHNCARHGATSQNRENRPDFQAHLQGQIAFVRSVNPQKAERLQVVFDRIEW